MTEKRKYGSGLMPSRHVVSFLSGGRDRFHHHAVLPTATHHLPNTVARVDYQLFEKYSIKTYRTHITSALLYSTQPCTALATEALVLRRTKFGVRNRGLQFEVLDADAAIDAISPPPPPPLVKDESDSPISPSFGLRSRLVAEQQISRIPEIISNVHRSTMSELMYTEINEDRIKDKLWRREHMRAWLLLSGAGALRDKPGQTSFAEYVNFDEEGGDLAIYAEALSVIDVDVPRTTSQSMTQRVWRELIEEKDREVSHIVEQIQFYIEFRHTVEPHSPTALVIMPTLRDTAFSPGQHPVTPPPHHLTTSPPHHPKAERRLRQHASDYTHRRHASATYGARLDRLHAGLVLGNGGVAMFWTA